MIQRIAFGVLCGLAFGIISASADDKPVRVAGTVESFDGQILAVKSSKLGEVKINLTADATVFGVAKATLADVKPGSYIGVGAMPQAGWEPARYPGDGFGGIPARAERGPSTVGREAQ